MDNITNTQEKFIDTLSAIRRKKKISQKEIKLAQKVVSRVENHETDPRLSTVITYLESIGYDINDTFKEESIMKRPNKLMVEHLNLRLKEEGTCLRYVEGDKDCDITSYELRIVDKYVDYDKYGMNLNISKEFEDMVREFFKKYGAENIGFTNTVATIFAIDEL
ncbi:TPA: helix-turn-helix transcriptional regulator [Clostridium botulinum]|nr:helix-turn-helix transcriptional regulator [Clostridium botulinum]